MNMVKYKIRTKKGNANKSVLKKKKKNYRDL